MLLLITGGALAASAIWPIDYGLYWTFCQSQGSPCGPGQWLCGRAGGLLLSGGPILRCFALGGDVGCCDGHMNPACARDFNWQELSEPWS